MKTKLLLFALIAAGFTSCSKEEAKPDNSGKTLRATYTFSPGATNAVGGYTHHQSGAEKTFSQLNSLQNFNDEVRVGDNIRLYMNGLSAPKGNFSIRLSLNGKQVSSQDGGADNRNIQLFYKVTDKDFE